MLKWKGGRLKRNLIELLLLPFVLYAMFRWFEYKQVYHPSRAMDGNGILLGRPWQEVWFSARDGTRLNGWFFPADPKAKHRDLMVLFCHGNAGNISHRLHTCQALLETGVGVFVFDYRGYGRSSGRPGEEGTYQDAEGAYDWLCQQGYTRTNIVAFGESLGGAVATELALRRPLRGLILISTFTSIPAIGAELFPWLPVNWICTIRYDSLSKLPRLNVPLLVMHSRADRIIGYQHGERLFAAANEPKLLWEVFGDHNDTLLTGPEQCQEGLRRFWAMLKSSEKEIDINTRSQ
jgi:fermentation-respiration switch protein FrsA (DUF1100 family)